MPEVPKVRREYDLDRDVYDVVTPGRKTHDTLSGARDSLADWVSYCNRHGLSQGDQAEYRRFMERWNSQYRS